VMWCASWCLIWCVVEMMVLRRWWCEDASCM
jgi:hypothetical protein